MNLEMNAAMHGKPLVETAWTILEAANDLRDIATVDVCRRVIDASLCGRRPAQSDIAIIFDFFG